MIETQEEDGLEVEQARRDRGGFWRLEFVVKDPWNTEEEETEEGLVVEEETQEDGVGEEED